MSRTKFKQSKTRITEHLHEENGAIIKDWGGRLPIALIYPNSYYLGMSNLGIHVIYRLLNSHRQVVCERVFWEKEYKDKKSLPHPWNHNVRFQISRCLPFPSLTNSTTLTWCRFSKPAAYHYMPPTATKVIPWL